MLWKERAEQAQQALEREFWNPSIRMYDIETPCPDGACNTIFHYWWMAHAADGLVDGLIRSGDTPYAERLAELHEGVRTKNGGAFPNLLYDDMEWMGIAWLRAYGATGEARYQETALALWDDIRTGWNETMGGGIAWHKEQLGYKNTPANGPAAILAARLYRSFGREEDLDWARRIYDWLKAHLVDPASGFVWDGMNRQGDGAIDKDWRFTYCQGVFVGAAVELYRATGDRVYLDDAFRTAEAAAAEWADGVLPDEGEGDGGLFKGILVRYLTELVAEAGTSGESAAAAQADWLLRNAETLWAAIGGADGERRSRLIGTDWRAAPAGKVTLSAQLSGVFLFEGMAVLEQRGLVPATVR
ncbi:glycoside hydrolase family 76 protein [Cohnella sp. REN36]|uniref:glycoside hydrolase family 76 protein n=1 Tax=Cohnella sp. REN36 TaxID=2887347 RepID=UPI001D145D0E|nr:glycoside hydrolase family 76 protein [Cohnella sp. REN36]MCC3376860.1 glycosyl hydrolase [Cohnella sp. REN36]